MSQMDENDELEESNEVGGFTPAAPFDPGFSTDVGAGAAIGCGAGAAANDGAGEEVDQSFMNLLTHFSNLDFPDLNPNALEECPLCAQKLPFKEFADHLLECLKQLDEVEKRHAMLEDEKMARRLSKGVTQHFHRVTSKVCPQGRHCQRRDAHHFQHMIHPDVPCPICGALFQMHKIEAHVMQCLEKGPPAPGSFASAAAEQPRGDMGGMSDGEEDEDKEGIPVIKQIAPLTTHQMSAMASMVCQKVNSGKAEQGEQSISELLDTFKTLGFTKESLQRQLSEDKDKKDKEMNQNASSAAAEP